MSTTYQELPLHDLFESVKRYTQPHIYRVLDNIIESGSALPLEGMPLLDIMMLLSLAMIENRGLDVLASAGVKPTLGIVRGCYSYLHAHTENERSFLYGNAITVLTKEFTPQIRYAFERYQLVTPKDNPEFHILEGMAEIKGVTRSLRVQDAILDPNQIIERFGVTIQDLLTYSWTNDNIAFPSDTIINDIYDLIQLYSLVLDAASHNVIAKLNGKSLFAKYLIDNNKDPVIFFEMYDRYFRRQLSTDNAAEWAQCHVQLEEINLAKIFSLGRDEA